MLGIKLGLDWNSKKSIIIGPPPISYDSFACNCVGCFVVYSPIDNGFSTGSYIYYDAYLTQPVNGAFNGDSTGPGTLLFDVVNGLITDQVVQICPG